MIYTSDNLFYDDVLVFLISLASFMLGMHAQQGRHIRFGPKDDVTIQRKCAGTQFLLYPYEIFKSLSAGQWPSSFELHEVKGRTVPRQVFRSPSKVVETNGSEHRQIGVRLLQSMFIHSYESVKETITRKHHRIVQNWPEVLRFAWIIRNAFAHNDKIRIDDSTFPETSWESLTFSSKDNGTRILTDKMGPGDVLKLLQDIEVELGK